jgi:hypothetical protein
VTQVGEHGLDFEPRPLRSVSAGIVEVAWSGTRAVEAGTPPAVVLRVPATC